MPIDNDILRKLGESSTVTESKVEALARTLDLSREPGSASLSEYAREIGTVVPRAISSTFRSLLDFGSSVLKEASRDSSKDALFGAEPPSLFGPTSADKLQDMPGIPAEVQKHLADWYDEHSPRMIAGGMKKAAGALDTSSDWIKKNIVENEFLAPSVFREGEWKDYPVIKSIGYASELGVPMAASILAGIYAGPEAGAAFWGATSWGHTAAASKEGLRQKYPDWSEEQINDATFVNGAIDGAFAYVLGRPLTSGIAEAALGKTELSKLAVAVKEGKKGAIISGLLRLENNVVANPGILVGNDVDTRGYDDSRKLMSGVWEALAVGGLIGGGLGYAFHVEPSKDPLSYTYLSTKDMEDPRIKGMFEGLYAEPTQAGWEKYVQRQTGKPYAPSTGFGEPSIESANVLSQQQKVAALRLLKMGVISEGRDWEQYKREHLHLMSQVEFEQRVGGGMQGLLWQRISEGKFPAKEFDEWVGKLKSTTMFGGYPPRLQGTTIENEINRPKLLSILPKFTPLEALDFAKKLGEANIKPDNVKYVLEQIGHGETLKQRMDALGEGFRDLPEQLKLRFAILGEKPKQILESFHGGVSELVSDKEAHQLLSGMGKYFHPEFKYELAPNSARVRNALAEAFNKLHPNSPHIQDLTRDSRLTPWLKKHLDEETWQKSGDEILDDAVNQIDVRGKLAHRLDELLAVDVMNADDAKKVQAFQDELDIELRKYNNVQDRTAFEDARDVLHRKHFGEHSNRDVFSIEALQRSKVSIKRAFENSSERIKAEQAAKDKELDIPFTEQVKQVSEMPKVEGIEFLDTPRKLKEEGKRMSHCVGCYADRVRSGESLIFGVNTKDGHSTLEIAPARPDIFASFDSKVDAETELVILKKRHPEEYASYTVVERPKISGTTGERIGIVWRIEGPERSYRVAQHRSRFNADPPAANKALVREFEQKLAEQAVAKQLKAKQEEQGGQVLYQEGSPQGSVEIEYGRILDQANKFIIHELKLDPMNETNSTGIDIFNYIEGNQRLKDLPQSTVDYMRKLPAATMSRIDDLAQRMIELRKRAAVGPIEFYDQQGNPLWQSDADFHTRMNKLTSQMLQTKPGSPERLELELTLHSLRPDYLGYVRDGVAYLRRPEAQEVTHKPAEQIASDRYRVSKVGNKVRVTWSNGLPTEDVRWLVEDKLAKEYGPQTEYEHKALGNVYAQEDKRGATYFPDQLNDYIGIFRQADATTLLHESFHVFTRHANDKMIRFIAKHYEVEYPLLAKWRQAPNSLSREEFSKLEPTLEKIAKQGELYLMKGVAPSVALRGFFDDQKTWLAKLYENYKQTDYFKNISLDPEAQILLERMLLGENKATGDLGEIHTSDGRRYQIYLPPEKQDMQSVIVKGNKGLVYLPVDNIIAGRPLTPTQQAFLGKSANFISQLEVNKSIFRDPLAQKEYTFLGLERQKPERLLKIMDRLGIDYSDLIKAPAEIKLHAEYKQLGPRLAERIIAWKQAEDVLINANKFHTDLEEMESMMVLENRKSFFTKALPKAIEVALDFQTSQTLQLLQDRLGKFRGGAWGERLTEQGRQVVSKQRTIQGLFYPMLHETLKQLRPTHGFGKMEQAWAFRKIWDRETETFQSNIELAVEGKVGIQDVPEKMRKYVELRQVMNADLGYMYETGMFRGRDKDWKLDGTEIPVFTDPNGTPIKGQIWNPHLEQLDELGQPTGKEGGWQDFKHTEGGTKFARQAAPDYWDILHVSDDRLRRHLSMVLAKLNPRQSKSLKQRADEIYSTFEKIHMMDKNRNSGDTQAPLVRRMSMEALRTLENVPEGFRDPRTNRMYYIRETDPYQAVLHQLHRSSSRMGFISQFGQDWEMLGRLETQAKTILGDDFWRFEKIMRSLNAMPLYYNRLRSINPHWRAIVDNTKAVYGFAKSLSLTMQVLQNPTELLSRGPNQLGWTRYARGIARFAKDSESAMNLLNVLNARTPLLGKFYKNPKNKFGDFFHIATDIVYKISGSTYTTELNELLAGLAAHEMVRDLKGEVRNGVRKNKVAFTDSEVLKQMGFTKAQVAEFVAGTFSDDLATQLMQRAPVFAHGTAALSPERTLGSQNPAYRGVLDLTTYINHRANALLRQMGTLVNGKGQERAQAATLLSKELVGSALQGAITVYLYSMAAGGLQGIRQTKREMEQDWPSFLVKAYGTSILGGPLVSLLKTMYGGETSPAKLVLSMSYPITTAFDLVDFVAGTGRYSDKEVKDRLFLALDSRIPMGRNLHTLLAGWYYGEDYARQATASKFFWRFKRNVLKELPTNYSLSEGQNKAFILNMRKASKEIAKGVKGDPMPYLMQALQLRGFEDSAVRQSILARRYLSNLSFEEKSKLYDYVGAENYQALQEHDLMLESWAEEFK